MRGRVCGVEYAGSSVWRSMWVEKGRRKKGRQAFRERKREEAGEVNEKVKEREGRRGEAGGSSGDEGTRTDLGGWNTQMNTLTNIEVHPDWFPLAFHLLLLLERRHGRFSCSHSTRW